MNLEAILKNPFVASLGIFDEDENGGISAKSIVSTLEKRSRAYLEKLGGYVIIAPVQVGKKKNETLVAVSYKKGGTVMQPVFEPKGKPVSVTGLLLKFMGFDGFTLTGVAALIGMAGATQTDPNQVEADLLKMMNESDFKFLQMVVHNGKTTVFGFASETDSSPKKIEIWGKIQEQLKDVLENVKSENGTSVENVKFD